MKKKKIRNIMAICLSTIAALIIFSVGEYINIYCHPYPEALDASNRLALKQYFNSQSSSIWFVSLAIWAGGSFVCGYLLRHLSRSDEYTLPVVPGCLLTIIGSFEMFTLPHPVWFGLAGFVAFIPFVYLGFWICGRIGK